MLRASALTTLFLSSSRATSTREGDTSSARQPRNLIFGGEVATLGKYPYYTDIRLPVDRDGGCGGTLVAPDMVLTHPQCRPIEQDVYVGWYNEVNEDTADRFSPSNDNVLVHPLYDDASFAYAFALIKLGGSSSETVPRLNNDDTIPSADTTLDLVGRGTDREGGFNLQNRLNEATLPFIDSDVCQLARSTGGWSYVDVLPESVFCAGSQDTSGCESDWGSPLVLKASSPQNDVIVGVMSWTFGCGGDTPSVFSRVSSGYDWLRKTICEESSSPPTYLNCGSGGFPQTFQADVPPPPPSPINFKWTFTPDDYNFENCHTLERIDGFEVTKVDYVVPGGIPFGFMTTYTRELQLQTGGLYVWTVSDSNKDGLGLDSGGAELFLDDGSGNFVSIHTEDEAFSEGVSYMFYATTDRNSIDSPYYGSNQFSNSSAFLKMTIEFDDYPWEFAWELTTEDGISIIYRPPRYYFNQDGKTVEEDFPVPERETNYVLNVYDTYGDGLQGSRTSYTITDPNSNILAQSQFGAGDSEEKTFRYGYTPGPSDDALGASLSTLLACLVATAFWLAAW